MTTQTQVRSTEEALSVEDTLKLALEQIKAGSYECAIDRLEEALAKPEQEPAKLWCETCEGTGEVYQEHQAGCHVGGHFKCPDCDGEGYVLSRLYSTTPPQRTWEGLTDEDVAEISEQGWQQWLNYQQVAQIVEAKLKEKNT